jgi:electron transfer flavoprotein beta subunit
MVAELLSLPAVTTIVDFAFSGDKITVKRELEGGVKAKVETSLPALVTCQLGLNTPRYPTLPNIMKAKKKELLTIAAGDLRQAGALQETVKIEFPQRKIGGLFLEGEIADIADRLISILKEKTAVLA